MQTEHAYDKIYLGDAISARGSLFLQVCRKNTGWDFSHFYEGFMRSKTAELLDIGWPRVTCLNGRELYLHLQEEEPYLFVKGDHSWWESAAEWSGWFLCKYQWYWNLPSKEIAKVYTPECLLRIWPGAHSQGLTNYVMDNPPAGRESDLT